MTAADQTPATMPLRDLLAAYSDGDERGWDTEFMLLRRDHADRIAQLTASIREDGITTPILLGNDGRVWDGHHRLCVADALGLVRVPVIQTPAKRCGECRLGLGVHTPTDPYCAHHQTPATDSERDEGRNAATLRLLASIERLGAETQAEDYLAEEVRHLLALVVEQAATIERVAAIAAEYGEDYIDAVDAREVHESLITALGSQRTEGQG